MRRVSIFYLFDTRKSRAAVAVALDVFDKHRKRADPYLPAVVIHDELPVMILAIARHMENLHKIALEMAIRAGA